MPSALDQNFRFLFLFPLFDFLSLLHQHNKNTSVVHFLLHNVFSGSDLISVWFQHKVTKIRPTYMSYRRRISSQNKYILRCLHVKI